MKFFIGLVFIVSTLALHTQPGKPCRDCPPPSKCGTKDSVMRVSFRDRTVFDDCISAVRTTQIIFDRPEQAIKLSFIRNGVCFDTTVAVETIESFSVVGLGLNGQPCNLVILPAREYVRTAAPPKEPLSFIELAATAGYGGSDESNRKVGTSTIFPGAELVLAPFGGLLGDKLALGFEAGVLFENSRMRIPLGAQLRLSFAGGPNVETVSGYEPSPCSFNTGLAIEPHSDDFTLRAAQGDQDSSVYFYIDKKLNVPMWRPFIYAEGGLIANGSFDGSGSEPSLNPDEYGQYFLGAGLGTPLSGWGTLSLAYRYMRLNLRTPCEYCPSTTTQDFFVLNTATVHSIMLKFGLRWDW